MVSVPAGRAAVPVTIRRLPAVLGDGNVAAALVCPDSYPVTAFCTKRIPTGGGGPGAIVKSTPVTSALVIVTDFDVGVNAKPDLPGVTVYVPATRPLKEKCPDA